MPQLRGYNPEAGPKPSQIWAAQLTWRASADAEEELLVHLPTVAEVVDLFQRDIVAMQDEFPGVVTPFEDFTRERFVEWHFGNDSYWYGDDLVVKGDFGKTAFVPVCELSEGTTRYALLVYDVEEVPSPSPSPPPSPTS